MSSLRCRSSFGWAVRLTDLSAPPNRTRRAWRGCPDRPPSGGSPPSGPAAGRPATPHWCCRSIVLARHRGIIGVAVPIPPEQRAARGLLEHESLGAHPAVCDNPRARIRSEHVHHASPSMKTSSGVRGRVLPVRSAAITACRTGRPGFHLKPPRDRRMSDSARCGVPHPRYSGISGNRTTSGMMDPPSTHGDQ